MVQQSKDLDTKRVVLLIRRVLHQVRCRKVPDAFHAISVRRLGWPKLQRHLWMRLTPLRRHRGLEVPGVIGKQDHVRSRRVLNGNAFKPFKPPLRIARLCTGRLNDRRILRITPTLSRLILTNQGPRVQQQHDRAGGVRPFHDFILQDNGAWLLFAGRLPGHLLRAPPFPTVLMQSPTHRFHAIRHLERGRHLGFDGLCFRGGLCFTHVTSCSHGAGFNDVGFGVSLNECRRSSPLASYGGPPFIRVATRRPRRNATSARAGCLASRTRPRNRIFSRPSR